MKNTKEMRWEIFCLMDDHLLVEVGDANQPVVFSHKFLSRNFAEFAVVGELREIIECLQHSASQRSFAFSFLQDTEPLCETEINKFIRGLALQTFAIEVCEAELSRRRRVVKTWKARDEVLYILNECSPDWRRQVRNEYGEKPELFTSDEEKAADAISAHGMGISL